MMNVDCNYVSIYTNRALSGDPRLRELIITDYGGQYRMKEGEIRQQMFSLFYT